MSQSFGQIQDLNGVIDIIMGCQWQKYFSIVAMLVETHLDIFFINCQ